MGLHAVHKQSQGSSVMPSQGRQLHGDMLAIVARLQLACSTICNLGQLRQGSHYGVSFDAINAQWDRKHALGF